MIVYHPSIPNIFLAATGLLFPNRMEDAGELVFDIATVIPTLVTLKTRNTTVVFLQLGRALK